MDFEFELKKEYFKSFFYGERLCDDKNLCLICNIDEDNRFKWDRYRLVCGHVFHTRCFRRWCGVKKSINCSYCGDIPEIMKNRYCTMCHKFGHSALNGDDCPTLNKQNSTIYIKRRQ
jgi:hypothetical protein